MIRLVGSWPRSQAGSATEAQIDFRLRGGTVMTRRVSAPGRDLGELIGDRLDVPVRQIELPWRDRSEDLLDEGDESPGGAAPAAAVADRVQPISFLVGLGGGPSALVPATARAQRALQDPGVLGRECRRLLGRRADALEAQQRGHQRGSGSLVALEARD